MSQERLPPGETGVNKEESVKAIKSFIDAKREEPWMEWLFGIAFAGGVAGQALLASVLIKNPGILLGIAEAGAAGVNLICAKMIWESFQNKRERKEAEKLMRELENGDGKSML